MLLFYNLLNSPAAIAVIQVWVRNFVCSYLVQACLLMSLYHYFQNLIPHSDPPGHNYFHLHTTLVLHLGRPLQEPQIKLAFQLEIHILLFPRFVSVII